MLSFQQGLPWLIALAISFINVKPADAVTCSAGYYLVNSTCVACTAGSYCAGGSAAPDLCGVGTYSLGSAENCTACPHGMTHSPFRNQCYQCPPGFACPTPSSDPTQCIRGTYSLGGSILECKLCPAGFRCPNIDVMPQQCPSGSYAAAGSTNCTVCPAGSACGAAADLPIACNVGEYSYAASTVCTTCPAGYECATASSTPKRCGVGYYALTGSTNCSLCDAGYACRNPAASPIACPVGFYSSYGSPLCQICESGWACPSTALPPFRCPLGTFSLRGAIACTPCPAGYSCYSPKTYPERCQAGTSALQNSQNCTACPPGSECPDPSVNPTLCAPGYYAIGSATTCTKCDVGVACLSTTSDVQSACAPGYFSFGGQSNCTMCPVGWECPLTSGASNFECRDGYYATGGASSCTACPGGHYCPSKVTATVVACDTGSFSLGSQSACTVCPAGYACPVADRNDQLQCSAGTYSAGGQTECTACPAGVACRRTNSDSQQACDSGYYSLGRQSNCFKCPAGYMCPSASDAPILCAAGQYSVSTSQRGSTECTSCPVGKECPSPDVLPRSCQLGMWSDGGRQACQKCDAGYVCPNKESSSAFGSTVASASTVFNCPLGYYCPAGSGSAIPCPPSTYGRRTNGHNQTETCLRCPGGFFCPGGQAYPTSSFSCPAGYVCPNGTSYSTEVPCSGGTYLSSTGNPRLSDCVSCAAGRYCPPGSTNQDRICPAGHYCPLGTPDYTIYPCPGGSYSGDRTGLENSVQCYNCTVGHFCPMGSIDPVACSPGTFNPNIGAALLQNCEACTAGSSCSLPGLAAPNGNCSAGHYCEAGTSFANQHACAAGTYTDSGNLVRFEDCSACPAGRACASGTGGTPQPSLPCSIGHYCPAGTMIPGENPCPPGTYSNRTDLAASSDCSPCPTGSFCYGGSSETDGECSVGYYCSAGSASPTENACPAGTYSNTAALVSQDACITCPEGSFCPAASTAAIPCAAGTYSNQNGTASAYSAGTVDSTTCQLCLAGYNCPEGSSEMVACAAGNYSSNNAGSCLACPAGHYCTDTATTNEQMSNATCPVGYYCPAGTTSATDLCPSGYYCAEGASVPEACPAGTYSPYAGAQNSSVCMTCTAGYYCDVGASNLSGTCDAGYYCGAGSTGPKQTPCPAGRYADTAGATSGDACNACPAGYYCPEASTVGVDCPQGYYCLTSTETAEPCPIGTYGSTIRLESLEQCTVCPAGEFCDGMGRPQSTGKCDPGYYCTSGAYTSAPQGIDSTGGPCPAGGWCSSGSSGATACYPGTFNNFTGAARAIDCMACDPGQYCDGTTNPYTSGDCAAGYYCTQQFDVTLDRWRGAQNSQDQVTPEGSYTTGGAHAPVLCGAGTYQKNSGQSSCDITPAGYYSLYNTTHYESYLCATGHYCPSPATLSDGSQNTGTQFSTQFACPVGTYNPLTGQAAESDCTTCLAGFYCATKGLSAPTGPCLAGYYCTGGASTEMAAASNSSCSTEGAGGVCPLGFTCPEGCHEPVACPAGYACISEATGTPSPCTAGYYCPGGDTTTTPAATQCPAGNYCLQNSSSPTPCEPGTYADIAGTTTAGCQACLAGKYCGAYGLDTASGDCSAGYYCPGGQSSSQPAEYICPAGSFCVSGSAAPQTCPAGTYSIFTGQSSCTTCPAGSYCEQGGTNTTACPVGSYCPEGATTPTICDYGSYSSAEGAPACTVCPAGYQCDQTGTSNFNNFSCPAGYYCEIDSGCNDTQQTAYSNPCPEGTYSSTTGLFSATQCAPCTPGMYCSGVGLTEPTGTCSVQYYCPGGDSNPDSVECPAGSTCPAGATNPVPCPAGFYCSTTHLANVTGKCSAGFLCHGGASSPTPTDGTTGNKCPAGYYCTEGDTSMSACPVGTYAPAPGGLSNATECSLCPAGQYCGTPGLADPSGDCSVGYYCPPGQVSPTPTSYGCPDGYYCPNGTAAPVPCDAGTTSSSSGACTPAPAGKWTNGNGTEQLECPAGYYCPQGTGFDWAPCPLSTFGNATGLSSVSQCAACTPGHYCASTGLSAPSGECQAGHYCEYSSIVPDQYECANGTYCVQGSRSPVQCADGSWSHAATTSVSGCTTVDRGYFANALSGVQMCASGYICSGGAVTSTPTTAQEGGYVCPAGYHCEAGATIELGCPPGTYQPYPGQSSCMSVSPGYYTNSYNATEVILCPQGYYCENSTAVISATMSGWLVAGYGAQACPLGTITFGASGLTSSDGCQTCPANYYCSSVGLGQASGPCAAGYICNAGSTVANPADGECPMGQYCLQGLPPADCPIGTWSDQTGLVEASQCYTCPAGSACNAAGLTSVPLVCTAGYYCVEGSTTPTPTSGLCPSGSACPTGSSIPTPCTGASFQDNTGQSECTTCTAGYTCADAAHTPCPSGHYCPAGSVDGIPCPDGTYSIRDDTALLTLRGLISADECTACPPGKYCQLGAIVADCNPGHVCYTGSSIANPVDGTTGQACSPGHYCLEGTHTMTACPTGYFNANPGSDELSDCQMCPRGYRCISGSTAMEPCAAGEYCDYNNDNTTQKVVPRYCPEFTYANRTANANLSMCITCPAGYSCSEEGIADYSLARFECTAGYYCPSGQSKVGCPGGTYRSLPGGASPNDCTTCPAASYCGTTSTGPTDCPGGHKCQAGTETPAICLSGTYCPVGSTDSTPCPAGYYCGNATQTPRACEPGTYCPAETAIPRVCTSHHYCPAQAATPIECPPGFYCPMSEGNRTGCGIPLQCPRGSFCPTQTRYPKLCPLGTYDPNPIGVLTPLEKSAEATTCFPCLNGTWGGDPTRETCPACDAGHICYYQSNTSTPTNSTMGVLCPAGQYCPAGAINGTNCPVTTFRESLGGTNVSSCGLCAAGTYQHLEGHTSCYPCGASAISDAGQTTCTCIGTSREFQQSSGKCTCIPMFTFYDEAKNKVGKEDGTGNCEPITYPTCTTGKALDASGVCADSATLCAHCTDADGNTNGEGSVTSSGLCECTYKQMASEACDAECRAAAPVLWKCGADYKIVEADGTEHHISEKDACAAVDSSAYGAAKVSDTCTEVQQLSLSATGVTGVISDTVESITARLTVCPTRRNLQWRRNNQAERRAFALNRQLLGFNDTEIAEAEEDFYGNETDSMTDQDVWISSSRRLQQTLASAASINTPLVCLQLNEGVSFNVESTSYPEYDKDSLINNNPAFDYGSFEKARDLFINAGSTLFTYEFTQAGIYAFYTSTDTNSKIVIAVMASGNSCPGTKIQALTDNNLIALQVSMSDDIEKEPDWIMIGGITGGCFGFVLCLIGLVEALRRKGFMMSRIEKPYYQEVGFEMVGDKVLDIHNTGVGAKETNMLENFSVATLYDKLEDQTIHVNAHLQAHERGFLHYYDKLGKNTQQLKALLISIAERLLSAEDQAEMGDLLTDVKHDVERASQENPGDPDTKMLDQLKKFTEKHTDENGKLPDDMDSETAKMLAGILGMAGGLAVRDGELVVGEISLDGNMAGNSGFVDGGGFQNAGGASEIFSATQKLQSEKDPEAQAMIETMSSQDDQVMSFMQQQAEKANQLLLEGKDDEARRILAECDAYRDAAARKLQEEQARQRRMLQERNAARRKAKADALAKKQAAELAEKENVQLIEGTNEVENVKATNEMDEFIHNVEEESENVLSQLRINIMECGDDPDAIARALAEYDKASKKIKNSQKDDLAARQKALHDRLANRKKKEKNILDTKHEEELAQVESGDPDQMAQVQLRHDQEDKLLNEEHQSAEESVESQLKNMEAVVDSVDYSAVTDDVEVTTDHELLEMFGINTEGKTAAEIMAELADAEARMKSGKDQEMLAKQEAMRKRLAARKKKLTAKMNFFSGKVPIAAQVEVEADEELLKVGINTAGKTAAEIMVEVAPETDQELFETFGIDTSGKTVAEIMAEVAEAEAALKAQQAAGKTDRQAALQAKLAARKKKLAGKVSFFNGKVQEAAVAAAEIAIEAVAAQQVEVEADEELLKIGIDTEGKSVAEIMVEVAPETDQELMQNFGIDTSGKTVAEIMAEVAEAEAALQGQKSASKADRQAALQRQLAARKKKLATRVNTTQMEVQESLESQNQKIHTQSMWSINTMMKLREDHKQKMQLEQMMQLEQQQQQQLAMARRSEMVLDDISRSSVTIIKQFIDGQQNNANQVLQEFEQQAATGVDLAVLLRTFEEMILKFEQSASAEQNHTISIMKTELMKGHQQRINAAHEACKGSTDPLQEAREMKELENIHEISQTHLTEHQSTLEAALQDLYMRLSTSHHTILSGLGAGNDGKSVAEILAEVDDAKKQLKAGADQAFSERQAALQKQLEARKNRRRKNLEEKQQVDMQHLSEAKTDLNDAELQAKHAAERDALANELSASEDKEQTALDQMSANVEQQLNKVDQLVENEASQIAATIEQAQGLGLEDRQNLVNSHRAKMDKLKSELDAEKSLRTKQQDQSINREISTREAKLNSKQTKMKEIWKDRAAEESISDISLRMGKLVQDRSGDMVEFESELDGQAQAQLAEFQAKIDASQAETLEKSKLEVDAQMSQLNKVDMSTSSHALMQMRDEANNRYIQVQSALSNEKARQMAVFETKQEERKKQKIEFKFGRLETIQKKMQQLHDVMQKGQEMSGAHETAVAALIEKHSQQEAEQAQTIEAQFTQAEADVTAKYQTKIDELKANNANTEQLEHKFEKQQMLITDTRMEKERVLQNMKHQQALKRLSEVEDLIDQQEDELAVHISTEESLTRVLLDLDKESQKETTAIEMEMEIKAPEDLKAKLESIRADHEHRTSQLAAKMESELAEYAKQEEAKEMAKLTVAQAEREHTAAAENARYEAEMKLKAEAATDEDAKKIMQELHTRQEEQKLSLASARQKQQAKMQEKIRAKKAKKQAELATKMNHQEKELVAEKQSAMREERRDGMWERELAAVQNRLDAEGQFDMNRVMQVVHLVLDKRHTDAYTDAGADMFDTRVRVVSAALGPVNAKYEAELRAVKGTPREQDVLNAQHNEVERVREEESKKLEIQWQSIEVEMKKANMQETLKMVAAAAPQFVEQVRSSIAAFQELEANHTGMEETDAKMRALLAMQAELGERKQEEVDAAIAELDVQSDAEARKERQKLNDQKRKLNVQKLGAIKKKTNEQDLLAAQASDQERTTIQAQNRADMLEFMKLLDDEENRQIGKLDDKARQRDEQRFQKRRAFVQQFNAQFKQHEEALKNEYTQVQNEAAAKLQAQHKELNSIQVGYQAAPTDSAGFQASSKLKNKLRWKRMQARSAEVSDAAVVQQKQPTEFKSLQSAGHSSAAQSALLSDGQIFGKMRSQMMDPLVSRIEGIERMLITSAQNANKPSSGGEDIYMDSKDKGWKLSRGTRVVTMTPDGLSQVQQASLQQASKAVKALPQGMHRIAHIVPASELPVTLSTSNTFSESYKFDPGTGKLYVRVERFDNLGELLTMLAHANAHIQCGSMDTDQDPRFQRELYAGLMALMTPQGPQLDFKDTDEGFTITQKLSNDSGVQSALAEVQIAQANMIANQQQQQAQQKDQLERKMTERSVKRDAQVKSIMTSKLTGGTATLSKAQARAQKNHVKKLFDAIDVDRSGALDSTEMDGLLNLLGINLPPAEHDNLMEQFGQDRVPFDLFFQWYST